LRYDGLGRRISKEIKNSGDWDWGYRDIGGHTTHFSAFGFRAGFLAVRRRPKEKGANSHRKCNGTEEGRTPRPVSGS